LRSLKDVLLRLKKIEETGADFQNPNESIDISTPAGWIMMQIVALFTEFEHAMLSELSENDLEAARQIERNHYNPNIWQKRCECCSIVLGNSIGGSALHGNAGIGNISYSG
jgi:DNA invertase Pin-like site-specific DNA recombinase